MKILRTVWISLIGIILGSIVISCSNFQALNIGMESENQEPVFQTAVARNGDILISTNGSGQVVPASEINLSFDQSGTIINILVEVGDPVKTGDVLLQLKTDKTEAQLTADIAAADLAVIQAELELKQLLENAEVESAQALIELEEAQTALEELTDIDLEKALALQKIALAKQAIADAEMLLYIYSSSPSDEEIYTLYASWLFKQENLENLYIQMETFTRKIKGAPDEAQKSRYEDQLIQLNVQLANQRLIVEEAIDKINAADEPADSIDVKLAETQLAVAEFELAAARREYDELTAGPKPGKKSIAEVNLTSAQAEWDKLKNGPDQDAILQAETLLEKNRRELEILKSESTIVELVAPINGIVIVLNSDVGDRYVMDTGTSVSGGTSNDSQTEIDIFEALFFGGAGSSTEASSSLVTIAGLSQPLLRVYIDETDFNSVAVGLPVEVVFDAFPDEIFIGEIVEVSPQLETVSNVSAIQTLVRLDETPYVKPNILPIGLNASVDVVAGEATNVVLVPYEALVVVEPGEYALYVIENDLPTLRLVTIGLIDYTSAEIIDGVSAGETVAIGYIEPLGNNNEQ